MLLLLYQFISSSDFQVFSQLIEFFPLCLTKFDFFFFKISAVFCDKEAAFKILLKKC